MEESKFKEDAKAAELTESPTVDALSATLPMMDVTGVSKPMSACEGMRSA